MCPPNDGHVHGDDEHNDDVLHDDHYDDELSPTPLLPTSLLPATPYCYHYKQPAPGLRIPTSHELPSWPTHDVPNWITHDDSSGTTYDGPVRQPSALLVRYAYG
jgi:hypothetical protein